MLNSNSKVEDLNVKSMMYIRHRTATKWWHKPAWSLTRWADNCLFYL